VLCGGVHVCFTHTVRSKKQLAFVYEGKTVSICVYAYCLKCYDYVLIVFNVVLIVINVMLICLL
jgi:hypothetical protein